MNSCIFGRWRHENRQIIENKFSLGIPLPRGTSLRTAIYIYIIFLENIANILRPEIKFELKHFTEETISLRILKIVHRILCDVADILAHTYALLLSCQRSSVQMLTVQSRRAQCRLCKAIGRDSKSTSFQDPIDLWPKHFVIGHTQQYWIDLLNFFTACQLHSRTADGAK